MVQGRRATSSQDRIRHRAATWQGLMWGTLPMASSLLAIGLVLLLPGRRKLCEPVEIKTSREREQNITLPRKSDEVSATSHIFVVTAILIALGTIGPTRLGATTGITSGSALPGLSSAAKKLRSRLSTSSLLK